MKSTILVILAFFAAFAAAVPPPDCSGGGAPVAVAFNVTQRCNRTLTCDPCTRNDYSADWLCCEDSAGWPALYFVTFFLVQFYFRNSYFTVVSLFLYEMLEHVYISFYYTGFVDYESIMGSFIGDVIQGLIGYALADNICLMFKVPPLIPPYHLARDKGELSKRALYILLAMLHILSVASAIWFSGSNNYGLWVNMGVQGLWFFIAMPFVFYTNRVNDIVWKNNDEGKRTLNKTWRRIFFIGTGIMLLAVELTVLIDNDSWNFMANNWFQTWVLLAPLLGASYLVCIVMALREHIYWFATVLFGFFLIALAVALYFSGLVLSPSGWDISALVVAAVGVVVSLGGLQYREDDEEGEHKAPKYTSVMYELSSAIGDAFSTSNKRDRRDR